MTFTFDGEKILEDYISPTLRQEFHNGIGFDISGIRYKVDPKFDFAKKRESKILNLSIEILFHLGEKLKYKLRSDYAVHYSDLSDIDSKVDELIMDVFPRFQRGFDRLHPSLKFHNIAPVLGSNFPKSMAALNRIISDKLKSQ